MKVMHPRDGGTIPQPNVEDRELANQVRIQT
jgi:hypothetical protein